MRVTNSMMITNMLSNLNKNLNVMSRKQDELSTGKKVMFASDDPVAAAKILKFKTDLADMDQYSTNTRDGQAMLDASESTVGEMGSVLQRVRELAVQAANGTNTLDDTKKIKEEILQLKEHLISGANSNFAGRYIFSSHYTDKPLLTPEGKYNIPITAQDIIDKPAAIYEISAREYIRVGTHGMELFGTVTEVNEFQSKMPDAEIKGVAAEKAAMNIDFSLTQDYNVGGAITVTVNNGVPLTFAVDKTVLVGSALVPLEKQKVLDTFRNTLSGATKLSDVADVYFDANKKLCIRDKTFGATGSLQMSAFAGASNPMNISSPLTPVPMALITDVVTGINAAIATNASAVNFVDPTDVPDFLGKKFVMTYNGITKTITIPNPSVTITTAAQLVTAVQGELDTAFGAAKVQFTIPVAGAITFKTVPVPGDTNQPVIRVQPCKTTESQLIKDMNDFITALDTGSQSGCAAALTKVDNQLNQLLAVRADIGARGSRMELVNSRISENSVTFTRLLSNAQDADMSEVIMYLKNAENVYKSALSVGGRIIQPSLMDFLR